jgi:hypothetical protein
MTFKSQLKGSIRIGSQNSGLRKLIVSLPRTVFSSSLPVSISILYSGITITALLSGAKKPCERWNAL